MKRAIFFWVAIAAIAATTLAGQADSSRRGMRDSLEAQRRFWLERRPRAYVIRTIIVGDCISMTTKPRKNGVLWRDRLIVRDTTIVMRESAPIARVYEASCERDWRVDDLFADVARALGDTTLWIDHVEYDAAYGFPRAYWISPRRDRGHRVVVESFAPAP